MRYLFISVFVCFSLIFGVDVSAQSLEFALEGAYNNNPALKSARERLKGVDEQIMKSLSRWLPSIAAQKQKAISEDGSVRRSGIAESISFEQNLFRGGADIAAIKLAQASVEQGRAELLSVEQKILLSVVDVYMKTLHAEEVYKISEERLEDCKKLVDFTEKRFKAGEGTKTDVAQARASMSDAQATLVSSGVSLETLRSQFFAITGIKPLKLIDPEFNVELPKTLDEMTQVSLLKNPTLVMQLRKKESASFNVDKVRGERILPKVGFVHQITDNRQNNQVATQGFEQPGGINRATYVSLTIPIFDGGLSWSEYRSAKRLFQEEKYSLMNAKDHVVALATQSWGEYESKKQILEARKNALDAANIAYVGVKKEEKAGLHSVGDVIRARNEYFQNYASWLDAKAKQIYSGYEVAAQIGQCNAKDLNLNVKLYDPFQNYNRIKLQLIGAY